MIERAGPANSFNLLDYWRIICRARWMIGGLVVASVLITGVVSKLSPKLYEAKATILPVKEDMMGGGGFSFGGGGGKEKGGGGSMMVLDTLSGKSGPTIMDTLQVLLHSRAMAEAVIDELNLMLYYETKSRSAAVGVLQSEVSVKSNAWKGLEITVLSKDPVMAANIANTYFSVLDRLNKEYSITATKRNRMFIEARLHEKTQKLIEAEEAMMKFQKENRIVDPSEQMIGAVTAAADLHAQIVGLEVELAALRAYALPSHPQISQLEAQIAELRHQLDRHDSDQSSSLLKTRKKRQQTVTQKVFPAFEDAPSLAVDFLRLARRQKVEEAVYGMLVGMLESAKIAEVRDLPTVQIMDKALPPEFPSRPQTLRNVQVAAGLSLVLGVLLAVFLDHLRRIRSQESDSIPTKDEIEGASLVVSDGNGNSGVTPHVSPQQIERLHS